MMQILTMAMLVLAADIPDSPGVIVPEGGFGNRATVIESNGAVVEYDTADSKFARYVSSELPEDDRGKFHLVVIYGDDLQSSKLRSDIQRRPELMAFRKWAKFEELDWVKIASDREYCERAGVRQTPTILIFPTKGHPDYPWKQVFKRVGYGGDSALLARNMYSSIRRFYTRHAIEKCPGPYCPEPYQPDRTPDRTPDWPDTPALPDYDWDSPADLPFGLTWPLVGLIAAVAVILYLVNKGNTNVPYTPRRPDYVPASQSGGTTGQQPTPPAATSGGETASQDGTQGS